MHCNVTSEMADLGGARGRGRKHEPEIGAERRANERRQRSTCPGVPGGRDARSGRSFSASLSAKIRLDACHRVAVPLNSHYK